LNKAQDRDGMTANDELINDFLTYLRAERGVSENTFDGYARDARGFSACPNRKLKLEKSEQHASMASETKMRN